MRVVFMGTPDFAVQALDAIIQSSHQVVGVITVPDRPTGRGLHLTTSPVKDYAVAHNLPLLQPEKLRDETFLHALQAWQADIFVVVAFRMLPQCVWAMPPKGTFNLHASLLPQYRGAAPINWAIINGETTTGITTFMLNEHIDEGAMLLQQRCEISPNDNAETLHDRLASMGRSLVVETLDGIANNTITPQHQQVDGQLKPAPKIFKADCAIPWHRNGQEIVNFVRGLSPYPAAIMQMTDDKGQSQQFKIYEVAFSPSSNAKPLLHIESDGKKSLKIKVNDGEIEILSLQMSGKKRISISEFLRGHSITNWNIVT